jgi:hypothetical protein
VSRYARKVDTNHADIRNGLRAAGYLVLDLSAAGNGVPDLCCAIPGQPGMSLFLEVKRPDIKKAEQAMTAEQEVWWRWNWRSTRIVQTLEEAIGYLETAKGKTP